MSNMSYCRFRNTESDLRDCQDALEELLGGQARPLSSDELSAAKRLVERCADILRLVGESAGLDVMSGEDDDEFDLRRDEILDQANASATSEEEVE